MELNLSTRLAVLRYFWYTGSNRLNGPVRKNVSSRFRASAHVILSLSSLGFGCLTQYQLFSRGSFSFRIRENQESSSPVWMRSGLVRTPVSWQEIISRPCFCRTIFSGPHQWCASHLDHILWQALVPLDSGSPLLKMLHQRGKGKDKSVCSLSQATVKRIIQFGLLMYVATKLLMRSISLLSPFAPTVTISPVGP
jgi:hypothetical protein